MAFTDLVSAPPSAEVREVTKKHWLSAPLSVLYYVYFFSACLIWCLPVGIAGFILRPVDRHKRVAHALTRTLAFHLITLNPRWKISFVNLHHYDKTRCHVVVANHQSMADVLVMSGLGGFYKWIAKAQIFAMPGVGNLMWLNDYICVAHGSLKSVRRMMRAARELLMDKISIFIFPEGTRSEDGNLVCFKEGPFRLAMETNTPVLPVVIDGTRDILPRGDWILNFEADITVKILDPIDPQDFANAAELCAEVKRRIDETLTEMRLGRAR